MSDAPREQATEVPAEPPAEPGTHLRVAVVLLVAASGAVETISFTALDHVFAGVMTSNLALLGMAVGRSQATGVTAAVLALAGFGLGAAVSARCTRRHGGTAMHWSRPVLLCLAGEALLLAVGAVVWAVLGGTPGRAARDALQFGAALTMGVQSGAMVAAGRAAAPTTYLTGTLATYIVKGVGAGRPSRWVPVRLGALIAGAAACMAVLRSAPGWAGLLPPGLVVCALLSAGAPAIRARRAAPGGK
ncbi:YoaK family protein [Streptomyces sp. NPDC086777]|uniref:YoaK family protein n=1 Tax=Streptomyces sp. NPDC086777 TaxID=3154866 RepID=UPI00344BF213